MNKETMTRISITISHGDGKHSNFECHNEDGKGVLNQAVNFLAQKFYELYGMYGIRVRF